METGKAYRKLIAFQRADNLVATIYQATKDLPQEELLGLVLHMRHVAYSIPVHIADGYTKATRREFYLGVKIACSSLAELEYFVDLILRLGYITISMHSKLSNEIDATARSLHGLLAGLKQEPESERTLAEAPAYYALAV